MCVRARLRAAIAIRKAADEDQVEVAPVADELEAEQLGARNRRAGDAAGAGFPFAKDEAQDEVRGERGDRQVEALHAQARQADDDAEQRGHEAPPTGKVA